MSHRIIQGDDIRLTVTVKEDSAVVDISSATTVTVALINGATIEVQGVAASGTTGADWTNGVIVILFTAAETLLLTENARLFVEVEVDNSGISSWVKADFDAHGQSIPVYGSFL